ncbi:MAG: hypothetical protein FWF71_06980 [Actinomycetia bacterium]|nr:hypothetical protein [Actinomycetes bacterium]
MRLLGEELRKVIKRRSVLVAMVLLLALNIFSITTHETGSGDASDQGYWRLYQDIAGPMTKEHIDFVMENYQRLSTVIASGSYETDAPSDQFYTGYAFGDMNIFDMHRQEMQRIFLYNSTVQQLSAEAAANVDFYRSVGNDYDAQKSQLVAEGYGTRVIQNYYEMSKTNQYLHYGFSTLLVWLLMVLAFCPLFAKERESGVQPLLRTSRRGRHCTVFAKTLAAVGLVEVATASAVVHLAWGRRLPIRGAMRHSALLRRKAASRGEQG